ncbi:MAG: DMT family transporter [Bacteroidetes bacterium]|nr:DMT family transporter [Bacteroidota bacterium]
MKKFHIPDYSWALAATLFWGLSFIWSSQLLKYYQPVTIIFIRLIISSGLLFLFIYSLGLNQKIARSDVKLILLSALFNPFFYFLGENYGLKYSTPTIAAVIIATIPVFSPIVAYLSFREKLTTVNFIGIAVSFIGVILILINNDFGLTADVRGVIFLFFAVIAALLYSVTLKKLTSRYSAVIVVAYQNVIGIFMFLPIFLIFEVNNLFMIPLNTEIVTSFLLLAILASSVSFVCFAHSMKLLGITKTNIFSNLIPVFTAFFSFLLLNESFTLRKIAGIAIVIGGVYLSERSKKPKQEP